MTRPRYSNPKYKKYRIFAEGTVEVLNMNAKDVKDDTHLAFFGVRVEHAKIIVKPVDSVRLRPEFVKEVQKARKHGKFTKITITPSRMDGT
jgi:hypothetical protein